MPELALYLLGPPRLEREGAPVHVGRAKVMALLAYLSVKAQPQAREPLVTLLSPELEPSSARADFRRTLSLLNRILGPGYIHATRETVAVRNLVSSQAAPGGARHEPSDFGFWVDVARFRACLGPCEARAHPPGLYAVCSACAPLLQEAVALYRDDFMAGFALSDSLAFEEWQFFQAEELRTLLSDALQRLCAWHRAQQPPEFGPAIDCARRWLALDPLHELAHRQLMALYADAGRRALALRQYRQCLRVLEVQLGIAPSDETAALYERIRASRETSTRATPPAPPPPRHVPAFLQAEAEPPTAAVPTAIQFYGSDEEQDFVARERELARFDAALREALSGQGQTVFITGGPGRGKTALMNAFARRAMNAHPDLLVVAGHCNAYAGGGEVYLPFRQVLGLLTGEVEARWSAGAIGREHARRLWEALPLALAALVEHGAPLIDTFVSGPALLSRATARGGEAITWLEGLQELTTRGQRGTSEWAQSDLFEAYGRVVRAVAAQRPLVLLLDDLQWANTGSASLLFHLGRELGGTRILMLVAYRPEEVALGRNAGRPGSRERHPLEKVLAEFKRTFGDVWIDLSQPGPAEARRFVEALLDTRPNHLSAPFRQGLFRHTQGHPLFTVELLRAMQERGDLAQDEDSRWVAPATLDWGVLPPRVEAVIAERLNPLAPELRELLATGSVEGEVFTAQVLASVLGLPEREVLRALSRELGARHRLVRELGETAAEGRFLSHYRFAHVLFQRHLYNRLSAGERRLLHGEIGKTLEALHAGHEESVAAPLAHHFSEAGETEKVIRYALAAGDSARLAHAHSEAVDHYQQALALQKKHGAYEEAGRTLMKLALVYTADFAPQKAREAYAEAFALWEPQWPSAVQTSEQKPGAILHLAAEEPLTLDPGMIDDDLSGFFAAQLFEGLVSIDASCNVLPALARRWDVTDGGMTYTFYLREGLQWNDGSPLTAGDFEYAWKRNLDPNTGSSAAHLLFPIRNAQAFHAGKLASPDAVGLVSRDERTLEVRLERPTAYLPYLLAHTVAYPLPRHIVERRGASWAERDNLISNGPYELVTREPGLRVLLARNPFYRGPLTGNVAQVECMIFRDYEAVLARYAADALDVVNMVGADSLTVARARAAFGEELVFIPRPSTYFLFFRVDQPPFDDVRVRRAFVYSIDRAALSAAILHEGNLVARGGLLPRGMAAHSPEIGLSYDLDRARRLLSEAGYPDGRGFPDVSWIHPRGATGEPIVPFLESSWRQNLGVALKAQSLDWKAFSERLAHDLPHLVQSGFSADYPDPDSILRVLFHSSLGVANSRWHNARFDRLVERAGRVADHEERMALYQEADRILVAEDVVVMPISYVQGRILLKPWVTSPDRLCVPLPLKSVMVQQGED